MKRKSILASLALGAVFSLTSCSSNDLYDPSRAEESFKQEFSKKFISKYGRFGADQSWDASSLPSYYSATTRADGRQSDYEVSTEPYYVQNATLSWLKEKLQEKKDNSGLGKPIVMRVPNNKFTIVPIFQGQAGLDWDLHLVVGTGDNEEDIKFWSKYEGMEVKLRKNGMWFPLSELFPISAAQEIRSKEYTFDFSHRAGDIMYLYLEITNGSLIYGNKGEKLSSLNEKMLYLEGCPVTNLGNKEVRIIGCEDATRNTDNDMNDVVFLMYGDPKVPDEIDISNKEIVESKTKRYMLEDLGSTDDFDFNDVVVDVTESVTKKLTFTNGVITDTEVLKTEQDAVIRHLGGSYPFQLTIGNTTLEEMEGQMGVNPNTKYPVEGWMPSHNNISAKVTNKSSGNVFTANFPGEGEIPMIIATDPNVNWMEERTAITKEWFDSLKK